MSLDLGSVRFDDDLSRVIPLERCANFRDLGGYETERGQRVRWRHLFRSMTPEYVTPQDVVITRGLNLRLVVDLRGRHYKSSGPLGELPERRLAVGNRRVLAPTEEALREYVRLHPQQALALVLKRMGRAYAKAASAIAAEEGPVLVHCRLGKDRTGVFIAVLLRALGVEKSVVIEDYMLSGQYLDDCNRIIAELEPPARTAHSRVARDAPHRGAITEVLRSLDDDYGGAEAYLRGHGMRRRDVYAFRERLLK